MRLLHVVATQQRRGAEVFAAALIDELRRYGIEQHVAVVRPNVDPKLQFEAEQTLLRDPSSSSSRTRSLDLSGVRKLRQLMRDLGPDVIQAHGGEALKYVLAAGRGRGGRVVYRRIGDITTPASDRLRLWVHARLMRRSARIIAVAEVLREELLDRYRLSPDQVVTIPNAVDGASIMSTSGRDRTRRALGIGAHEVVVLSLGALTWEKDPLAHLDIVAKASGAITQVVHVIAGDGPLRDRVGDEASRAVTPTLLLGSRDDVADLLTASDVLLLASQTEGMPACIIEAGMAGLPVVGYAIAGVPEVVLDGRTGRLARPGDADSLAAMLGQLLRDTEGRRRLGLAAAERCRQRFDISTVAPRYLSVYEGVARPANRPIVSSPRDLPSA
jgi:glycosyltransferase involved in cell wall biosynthesis